MTTYKLAKGLVIMSLIKQLTKNKAYKLKPKARIPSKLGKFIRT